jgi:hypothetical protein
MTLKVNSSRSVFKKETEATHTPLAVISGKTEE